VLVLRSFAYLAALYGFTALGLVFGWPMFLRRWPGPWPYVKFWAGTSIWLHRVICKVRVEYRGLEHVPDGGFLVASKHQSMWETLAFVPAFRFTTYILKQELMAIPMFGWAMRRTGMIAIDREAGARALVAMTKRARAAIAEGRQVVIFPEGTRTAPGAPPAYKAGVAYLYEACDAPCLPVALNSGLYWPRRSWRRYPGTIVVEFLPPIPPGLSRKAFLATLEERIETATSRLIAEAAASPEPPPIPNPAAVAAR
jgi:1-acyl-sn-glycerol-3-phosphate acyltransferase